MNWTVIAPWNFVHLLNVLVNLGSFTHDWHLSAVTLLSVESYTCIHERIMWKRRAPSFVCHHFNQNLIRQTHSVARILHHWKSRMKDSLWSSSLWLYEPFRLPITKEPSTVTNLLIYDSHFHNQREHSTSNRYITYLRCDVIVSGHGAVGSQGRVQVYERAVCFVQLLSPPTSQSSVKMSTKHARAKLHIHSHSSVRKIDMLPSNIFTFLVLLFMWA